MYLFVSGSPIQCDSICADNFCSSYGFACGIRVCCLRNANKHRQFRTEQEKEKEKEKESKNSGSFSISAKYTQSFISSLIIIFAIGYLWLKFFISISFLIFGHDSH